MTIRSGSQPAIPGRPTIPSPTTVQPGIASIASRARADAAIVRSSSASPWAPSWRRALSSDASSSELGLVERTSRTQRATWSGSIRLAGGDVQHRRLGHAAHDLVGRGQHRVGAQPQRRFGKRRVKAEMRAPCAVDHQRRPGGVSDLGAAADVSGHSVVGGRDDERRADVRRARQRHLEGLRRDAVGHAKLVVVLRGDEARHSAAQHQPVDDAGVRVALYEHVLAGLGQRQAQGVVALGGAVGQKPRLPRAVTHGRQLLRALVRSGGRPGVDPLDVLADVERQRALADRRSQPGVRAGASLVARHVKAHRAAQAVGDDRLQVGSRRQLPGAPSPLRGGAHVVRLAHQRAIAQLAALALVAPRPEVRSFGRLQQIAAHEPVEIAVEHPVGVAHLDSRSDGP